MAGAGRAGSLDDFMRVDENKERKAPHCVELPDEVWQAIVNTAEAMNTTPAKIVERCAVEQLLPNGGGFYTTYDW
jgi:hypothetical protein